MPGSGKAIKEEEDVKCDVCTFSSFEEVKVCVRTDRIALYILDADFL